MAKLNSYLNFDGTAEEAFNFYRSIFGGEFLGGIHKMNSVPGMGELSEDSANRVMHVSLPIGNDLLMGSDIIPEMGQALIKGNTTYVSIFPESREEAERIFNALSEGGEIEMPLEDQFWGDYYGSFMDKFGIGWMVNYSDDQGYAG